MFETQHSQQSDANPGGKVVYKSLKELNFRIKLMSLYIDTGGNLRLLGFIYL